MRLIILYKGNGNFYFPKNNKIEDPKLDLIYDFLECDGIILVPNLILDWIDSDENWMGTNVCFLRKEDKKIVLGWDHDEDEEFLFSTSKKYFITMVKKWLEVRKKEPKEITISLYDDGQVEISLPML
ncbi:hypothetical protein HN446_01660 [bacterium]|jgi:hypothetical protein|nr:hypothetical protein [bacterium]